MNRPDWDTFFVTMAHLVAQRSPDAETKIGAILVGHDHKILSLGFNGFPRGCYDKALPNTRPEKYYFIVHAEANCLINASIIPNPEACTLYCTARPCPECTKQIIQYGIGNVIYDSIQTNLTNWNQESEDKMKLMLDGVNLRIKPYHGTTENVLELFSNTENYLKEKLKTQ